MSRLKSQSGIDSFSSSSNQASVSEGLSAQPFQLKIFVSKAELTPIFTIVSCNTFIVFTYSGNSNRTHTKYSTLTPVFDEELFLPVFQSSSQSLFIDFYLEKLNERDQLIYQIQVPFNEVSDGNKSWKWFHLYAGEHKSNYFGKVLVKFDVSYNLNPIEASYPLTEKVIYPATKKYIIWFELIEISGLGLKENITVTIELGTKSFKSSPAKPQNQRWVWGKYSQFPEIQIDLDTALHPDFLIKVFKSEANHCISSLKKSTSQIIQQGSRPPDPTWEEMTQEDAYIPFLGYCLSRVNIVPMGEAQHFRPDKFEYTSSLYEIQAYIFQAQNIQINDIGGLADPFISVSVNGVSKKTQVQRQCLNPQWNEALIWKMDLFSQRLPRNSLSIYLWEWNEQPEKPLVKGKGSIDFAQIQQEKIGKPAWYTLESKSTIKPPRILAAFGAFRLKEVKQVVPVVKIEKFFSFVKFTLAVRVVGARKVGLLDRHSSKVFFKVSFADSRPILTRAVKVENNRNFNFYETVKSTIKVPNLKMYTPSIVISLLQYNIDNREILLGSVNIPLNDYVPFEEEENSLSEKSNEKVADATQITENEEVEENNENNIEKWPGYNKKIMPRKEISCSFEEFYGVLLPFDSFWLERLESEDNIVKSGFVRCKIKVYPEASQIDEGFKDSDKLGVLYARLYIYSIKGLGENLEGVYIWIKTDDDDIEHKYLDNLYIGDVAEINATYTIKLNLPKDNFLLLELYSASDQKLWSYEIDIEQRWFNKKFKSLNSLSNSLPIETLHSSSNPSTSLQICLELLTTEAYNSTAPDIILSKISSQYEFRLIIYKAKNLDSSKKDLKIKGYFSSNSSNILETDVHSSATDSAEFNWRFKFPVTLPEQNPLFILEVYNIATDSLYGQSEIDFSEYFEDVHQSINTIFLPKKWVRVKRLGIECGMVLIEACAVTQDEADDYPVAIGRDAGSKGDGLVMPNSGRDFEGVKAEIERIKMDSEKKRVLFKRCIAFWVVILILITIPIAVYSAL